jgi:hypothetical protein
LYEKLLEFLFLYKNFKRLISLTLDFEFLEEFHNKVPVNRIQLYMTILTRGIQNCSFLSRNNVGVRSIIPVCLAALFDNSEVDISSLFKL